MSEFTPGRFRIVTGYDIGTQEFVCRLVCAECDPDEPESVAVWSDDVGHALPDLEDRARDHWKRWHTSE